MKVYPLMIKSQTLVIVLPLNITLHTVIRPITDSIFKLNSLRKKLIYWLSKAAVKFKKIFFFFLFNFSHIIDNFCNSV